MLAYLFAKFPSFTQTFCAREVAALRAEGVNAPVFSISRTGAEPIHQNFPGLGPTTYLPQSFKSRLFWNWAFRRAALSARKDMKTLWGADTEKYRIYEALWMRRVCRQRGIHHVHTHFVGVGARAAFWLHRLGGIAYSVTAHANDIFRDEPPERLGQILRAAACVVTVSDFSRRLLARQFPDIEGRLYRVYNGIASDSFPPAEFPDGPPLIVSIGRAIEKKGFPDLIAACRGLGARGYECVILGGGPMEADLRDSCADLGGKVRILGALSQEEIRKYLRRARVFVLPCVTAQDGAMDNLPTVIMEAMASGLPVISTPLAGIPEMVQDGVTGRLVPERDPIRLAEALSAYLDDPALARQHGVAGRGACLQHFDISRTAPELIRVFRAHGALAR